MFRDLEEQVSVPLFLHDQLQTKTIDMIEWEKRIKPGVRICDALSFRLLVYST